MLCDNCKMNIATTHIKRIINGVSYEKHLCNSCYQKQNETTADMSISDILVSMLDNSITDLKSKVKRCENCGSSFKEIANSGKVGCYKCYETFYDNLLPYIKRVHGSTKHIGKTPNTTETKDNISKLDLLKKELKELIEKEDFEQAVIVRDKIKDLEGREN